MRILYILGWGYVAIASTLVYRITHVTIPAPVRLAYATPTRPPTSTADPASWYEQVRRHCNPVEVEITLNSNPPPATWQDQAYAAACYALAGKIERAAERIDALPAGQRAHAAGIVFNEGHPVADLGDDEAAGPLMELVVRYAPDNYMALYHAGMAQYRTDQPGRARVNLERFLELYQQNDGWTSSARAALRALGEKEGA